MPVCRLTDFRSPLLRTPSRPGNPEDREAQQAVRDLWDTLGTKKGLAMAAPQIGIPLRLFVFDLKRPPEPGSSAPVRGVLFNPVLLSLEGSVPVIEGCLSFPGLDLPVRRPETVTVSGQNERGESVRYTGGGLFARMIAHEIDHLDGILLPDRQSSWGRLLSSFRRLRWERARGRPEP